MPRAGHIRLAAAGVLVIRGARGGILGTDPGCGSETGGIRIVLATRRSPCPP